MNWLSRLLARFGFGKRLPQMTVEENNAFYDDIDRRLDLQWKTRRLRHIAITRSALKDDLERAKRQKKARTHIYAHLDALKREEMAIAGDLP